MNDLGAHYRLQEEKTSNFLAFIVVLKPSSKVYEIGCLCRSILYNIAMLVISNRAHFAKSRRFRID